jgi:predicted kinase
MKNTVQAGRKYSKQLIQKIMVVFVTGLPGTGKTFFSKKLAIDLHAVYLNSDQIRNRLFRHPRYTVADKWIVYDVMLKKMLEAIYEHKNVVLDATFYKNNVRKRFTRYLSGQPQTFFIEMTASEPVIKERLQTKREESQADYEVYKALKKEWEPLQTPHLTIKSGNIQEMMSETFQYLKTE